MRESDYFDSAAELKPLLHTWSLAVEEQFYLLFPAFLILIWKLGARWTWGTLGLLFVGSFAAAQWAVHEMPAAAFYLLPTRAWELLVGTVVAIHLSKPRRAAIDQVLCEVGGWLGIALILAAILTFDRDTPFPGLHALVPTLGTALIILFATPQTTAGRFVGNRVFVSIGLISYSAYLWHQPLFAFARHRNSSEPDSLAFVALSALTLALAYLSWRFVEAPFRSRTQFSRRSILLMTLLCTMFFVSVGVRGHKSNGFAGRLDPELAARIPDITQFQDQVEPCWRRIEQHPSVAAACPLGSQAGPIRFGLLGDSHASCLDSRSKRTTAQERGLDGCRETLHAPECGGTGGAATWAESGTEPSGDR